MKKPRQYVPLGRRHVCGRAGRARVPGRTCMTEPRKMVAVCRTSRV